MDVLDFVLIGILQGIFEWLPVSSQGILVVVLTNLFKTTADVALDMSIFLHFGTLLAAFVYFYEDIINLFTKIKITNLFKKDIKFDNSTASLQFILFSVFITVLIGTPLYFLLRKSISVFHITTLTIAIGVLLILTGIMQIKFKHTQKLSEKLNLKNSFLVGLFQGFSVFPGVSRSGITTSVMLFQGFSPENAFKYSFLISIPTILIAELGILFTQGFSFNPLIIVSVLFAFVFGYITIGLLMKMAKKLDFSYFCFVLGIAYIIIALI